MDKFAWISLAAWTALAVGLGAWHAAWQGAATGVVGSVVVGGGLFGFANQRLSANARALCAFYAATGIGGVFNGGWADGWRMIIIASLAHTFVAFILLVVIAPSIGKE